MGGRVEVRTDAIVALANQLSTSIHNDSAKGSLPFLDGDFRPSDRQLHEAGVVLLLRPIRSFTHRVRLRYPAVLRPRL